MTCVLVTGGTGFLGGKLLDRFAKLGVQALAIGRDLSACERLQSAGHAVFRHDLAVPFDRSSHGMLDKVDAVVHCAALSSPYGRFSDFFKSNVTATANLVNFARQQNIRRFVHISTPSVYFAFRDQLDVREDAKLPAPVNHYANTKVQAEKIVIAAPEIGPVILRPRGIYGPGDTALLPRLLRVAGKRPLPLFRDGAACIDLTYVEDVVDAILAALDSDRSAEREVFNISGGEVLAVQMIVEKACMQAGVSARWKPASLTSAMIAVGMLETVAGLFPGRWEPPVTRYGLGLFAYAQSLNISKAAHSLGWKPKTSFDEGLDLTFQKQRTS